MENQRPLLVMALLLVSAILYIKWIEFTAPPVEQVISVQNGTAVPSANLDPTAVPSTPTNNVAGTTPVLADNATPAAEELITVSTDLMVVNINTFGGVIQLLETVKESVSIEEPEQGFPLLKKQGNELFVAEDGLLVANQTAPSHTQTQYQAQQLNYELWE